MKRATKMVMLTAALLAGVLGLTGDPRAESNGFGFTLNITLSKMAADKLVATKEGLVIDASFYGDPKPGAGKHVNDIGQIDLGRETLSLHGKAGKAVITGNFVKPEQLKWVRGPGKVNVNVYSARKGNENNILNCDLIDGDIGKIASKEVTLHCALIEENYVNQSHP